MNFKFVASLCLALAIVFIANNIYSWGDVGHKTIAYIAEINLSKKTLRKIHALFSHEDDFISVSTWADDIKKARSETQPWHYIDIPIRENIKITDLPNYYNGDSNLISQLNKKINDLKDAKTDQQTKQEALMFIIHFIGDLHCPLHCSDDTDRGGNEKKVVFINPKTKRANTLKLHALWDHLIEVKAEDIPETYGAALNKKITKKMKEEWQKGSIEYWALETYNLSKHVIYKELKPGESETKIILSKDYHEMMKPYVDEQLEKAGIRLAFILEDIFNK